MFDYRTYQIPLLLLFMLSCIGLKGQQLAVGSETLVNVTTANDQRNPAVAVDSSGNYVVVWESYGQDGDGYGIYFQVYDSAGNVLVAETQANTTTDDDQRYPDVGMAGNGNFVITWMSHNNDGDGWGVYARMYDITGTALTGQQNINNTAAGDQMHPRIGMNSTGEYAIVWMDSQNDDSSSVGVYGRTYYSSGAATNTAFIIPDNQGGYQGHPDVAVDDQLNMVVVWQNDGLDGDASGIFMKKMDLSAVTLISETQVNSTSASDQQEPAIATGPTGNFMVVWTSFDQDGSAQGIFGQLYDSTGASIGSEMQINSTSSGAQDHAAVAVDGTTGFYYVTWSSYGTDGSYYGVYQQAFQNDGSTFGSQSLVNTRTTDFQQASDIALFNENNMVVVWQDGLRNSTSTHDGDDYGIYTQRFQVKDTTAPTAVCQNVTIYLDGSGAASITANDVDGGSSDNLEVTSYSVNNSNFSCNEIGSNVVTLTVADAAGNTDACIAVVTVVDSTSPSPSCQNLTVYLDGSGSASITGGDVDNGSTDNCSISSYSVDQSAFTCANTGSNTVTLTITDGSGNSSTCSSVVTVVDSTSPTALCQNLTVYLDGSGAATITGGDVDAGSTDNCSLSYTLDQSSFSCNDIGSNTVNLNVEDPGGNTASCAAVVTVVDSVSPTAACQAITVYLDGSGNATITTNDVDNGSSDNCSISSSSLDVSSFTCSNIGVNTVTLSLSDASSNSSTCTSSVTVVDSTAPTAACQSAATVYLDGSGNASITTNDIDNGSTDNCSISSSSLDVSSFTCANVGTNTVTLTLSDASSNVSTCTSTVTVVDSTAPTAACQSISVYLDGSGSASITTNDIDNGSADNCSISSSSLDVSSFACANVGTNTVTLTVSDASSNSATCTAIVTVIDSTSPTASCQAATVYLDGSGNATISTNDVDNGSSDNCSISSSSLDVSSFTCANIGANTVTLTVSDASSNSTTCSSTVTVVDSTAPTASCQATTVYLDGSGNATITTNDIDNGSTDNCSISSSSPDVSSFTCANIGTNTVTLTLSDASSNSSSCTATVTVVDSTAPTAACQSISVYLDGSGSASITTNDIDNGSADNCSISSSSLDVSSFACANVGTNTVTLTVSDASSNSATCTAIVTVIDSTSPTASCQAATVYLDGSGNATISTNDVDNGSSDNCSISSSSLDVSSFICANIGANTVTLTVSDASSNSTTCSSTVTVVDSTAPTASCQATTVYLDGSGNATITTNDVDNGSSDNCSISSSSLDVSSFTCANIGTNTVTLTLSDASSNSSTCTSTVTVVDSTAPTAACQSVSIYLDGSGSASIMTNDIDNGSADNCSISSSSLDVSSFACANVGTNTVTLTVSDASSNSATCTAIVTVIDSTSPTASCQAATVYLDGSGNATITTNDVDNGSSDNCSISSSSLDVSSFTCANIGANTVTLTVSDASSNSTSCSSTVTVVDSTAPTASCQAATVYLDGSGNATITTNDIDNGSSDNCSISSSSLDVSSFTCANIGTNTVTLTLSDASANSSTCTSTVTVVDSTAPTVACQSISVYLDGSGSASITTNDIDGGSSDNCAVDSLSLDISSFDCNSIGSQSVVLTAFDASGNSGNCTATVTVLDTLIPTALCQNTTVYLDANGSATLASTSVDNGSTDNCTLSLSLDNDTFSCGDVGSNTVTLTVADPAGNTATCQASVTVEDTLAPTVLCVSDTLYLNQQGQVFITPANVDGGSSDNCGISSMAVTPSMFNAVGTFPVTLVATDVNGNVDSCLTTVFIDTLTAIAPPVSQTYGLSFELRPNPAEQQTEVRILSELPAGSEKAWLTLTDLSGKVLLQRTVDLRSGEYKLTLDLNALAAGTYLVNLRYGQRHLFKKLMKY